MIKLIAAIKLKRIFLFFLIAFFFGCSSKSSTNLSVYRALASSLNNSNMFITSQNFFLIKSLEKKLAEPSTSQKTLLWLPKALLVQKISKNMIEYIDSLKQELEQEAGLKMVNGNMTFRENDVNAVTNLFNKKGNGEKLKHQLQKFESDLLAIDPEMTSIFSNIINITIRLSDPSEDKQKTFTETFFKDIPTVAGLAVLSKFQNNVEIMEYQFIAFCENKIPK